MTMELLYQEEFQNICIKVKNGVVDEPQHDDGQGIADNGCSIISVSSVGNPGISALSITHDLR